MSAAQGMILIDIAPGEAASFDQRFLERNDHPVVVCHGPDHGSLCPILSGAGCEWVTDAHGIVFVLDLDRPQHRAILARYSEVVREGVPIRAVVHPGQREPTPRCSTGSRCGSTSHRRRTRRLRRRGRSRRAHLTPPSLEPGSAPPVSASRRPGPRRGGPEGSGRAGRPDRCRPVNRGGSQGSGGPNPRRRDRRTPTTSPGTPGRR